MRLGHRRAADHHPLQGRQRRAGLAHMGQQHLPDGRHGGGEGDALGLQQFVGSRRRPSSGPASPAWRPPPGTEKARPQALAWNIGTTGSTVSRADRPITSRLQGHQGVQEVGAVRIEHALGIARGAGGVAEPAGGLLVEAAPDAVGVVASRSGSRSRARPSGRRSAMWPSSVRTMTCSTVGISVAMLRSGSAGRSGR